jgi:hypothetical protein
LHRGSGCRAETSVRGSRRFGSPGPPTRYGSARNFRKVCRNFGVEELHPPALVSRSCLGTREFGFTIDEAASLVALDAAVDAGSNSVDTADV